MRSTQATATRRRPALDGHERPRRLQQLVVDEQSSCFIAMPVRPLYPSPAPAEVCYASQHARPAARRLARACLHRPAPLPAASSRRIPLRPPTLSRLHTLAPAGSPGRDRRAQACCRRRGKGAPDPVRPRRARARRPRQQVASWTPTSPPLGWAAVRRSASNPRPSRPRTAPATAPCVARAPAGLLLSHASLRVAAAGARRRLDPCCPCVQVARGGRMEPHMGSWCDPPAQLAAPARPQAWARL